MPQFSISRPYDCVLLPLPTPSFLRLAPTTKPPPPLPSLQNPELTIRLKVPRANDLGSSEFGRVRKRTLKAEEATSSVSSVLAGSSANPSYARRAALALVAEAEVSAAALKKSGSRRGRSGSFSGSLEIGEKRKHSGSMEGGRERWPAISVAPQTPPWKPLWPPGKRPKAGREGAHTRSNVAAERLVDACIGAAPLEDIAAVVLLGRSGKRQRRSGACVRACSLAVWLFVCLFSI